MMTSTATSTAHADSYKPLMATAGESADLLAHRRLQWWLYGGLGVGTIGAMVMAIRVGGLIGVSAAVAVAIYAICIPIVFYRQSKISRKAVVEAHPRYGAIVHVPKTAAGQIGIVVASTGLWLFFFAVAWWLAGAPKFGAGWEVVAVTVGVAALLPSQLAEIALFRRWGPTPPSAQFHVQQMTAAVCGGVFSGAVLWALKSRLPNEFFEFGTSYLPVALPVFQLVEASFRYRRTRYWQARLQAEMQRAELAEQARQLAESHLALLQAQIEPHFLYNTLASVQYLVRKDQRMAEFLLRQLIRYLRQSMPTMRAQTSTLGREFELVDAYLQIARIRMGGRLMTRVELEPSLQEVDFPPLMLPTLVENALKHGVEPKPGEVCIEILAERIGDRLRLTVRDDGVGLGGAPTAGGGTGLRNLRQRLAAIYGADAALVIASRPGNQGVLARIDFPIPPPAPASEPWLPSQEPVTAE